MLSDSEAADAIRAFVDNNYWTALEVIDILRSNGYEIVKKEPADAKD